MKTFLSFLKIGALNILLIGSGLIAAEIFIRAYGAARSESPLDLAKYIQALKNDTHDSALNKSGVRHPFPYVEFKGRPFSGENNSDGFRFTHSSTSKSQIKVAFFGGSTGYIGDPPIPGLIETLVNKNGFKTSIDNYSVVSSNHNQHMHSIVEHLPNKGYDLVIFYGGYNELLQPRFYDPRPGYPYNFNLSREMKIEHQLLYKHSLLFRKVIEVLYGGVNNFLGIKQDPNSSGWEQSIVENYISTAKTSRKLSRALLTGRCSNPFLIVYQSYNYEQKDVPETFKKNVHQRVSGFIDSIDWGINTSQLIKPGSVRFTDIVHIDQKGNNIVAQSISDSKTLANALNTCRIE